MEKNKHMLSVQRFYSWKNDFYPPKRAFSTSNPIAMTWQTPSLTLEISLSYRYDYRPLVKKGGSPELKSCQKTLIESNLCSTA